MLRDFYVLFRGCFNTQNTLLVTAFRPIRRHFYVHSTDTRFLLCNSTSKGARYVFVCTMSASNFRTEAPESLIVERKVACVACDLCDQKITYLWISQPMNAILRWGGVQCDVGHVHQIKALLTSRKMSCDRFSPGCML